MRIVLGLGNPGARYEGTRHNLGCDVVRAVARELGIDLAPGPGPALLGRGSRGGRPLLLVCPLTWMNRSGDVLAALFPGGPPPAGDLLVVVDDVDLVPGRMLLRAQGSDGGHRGLRSLLAVLATDRVPRLRLGVGRGPAGVETADHVLARPEGAEVLALEKAVAEGALAVISWLDCPSIQIAMNLVNRPPPEDPSGEGPAG